MMLYTLLSMIITMIVDFFVIYIYKNLHQRYHQGMNETDMLMNRIQSETVQNSLGNYANNREYIENKIMADHFSLFFYVIVIILSVVLFLLLFQLLSRRTVLYLHEITDALEKISEGDFSTRVPVRYDDEFALIADNINRMTMDLEFLKQSDDQTEKRKNELITNVAHDLRTPLTSVLGYLDILNTHPELSEEKKASYINIAYNKAAKLQTLIEDLFSFTKITCGQMPLKLSDFDLVKLLEQEVEEFYPDFADNHLTCDFKTEVESAMIKADSNLIARAFENLISNAVKYGRDGKVVRIHVSKRENAICTSVTNYGLVIPKEDLALIFEKFYRVERSRKETLGGTGLGLSIARAIVENHGGTITVSSTLEGTVFTVMLPAKKESEIKKEK